MVKKSSVLIGDYVKVTNSTSEHYRKIGYVATSFNNANSFYFMPVDDGKKPAGDGVWLLTSWVRKLAE